MNLKYLFIRAFALLIPVALSYSVYIKQDLGINYLLVLLAGCRMIGGISLLSIPFSITRSSILLPRLRDLAPNLVLLLLLSAVFQYYSGQLFLLIVSLSLIFFGSEYFSHALAASRRSKALLFFHGNPLLYILLLLYVYTQNMLSPVLMLFLLPIFIVYMFTLLNFYSSSPEPSASYQFTDFRIIGSFSNLIPRVSSFFSFYFVSSLAPSLVPSWSLALVIQSLVRIDYIVYLPIYLASIPNIDSQGCTVSRLSGGSAPLFFIIVAPCLLFLVNFKLNLNLDQILVLCISSLFLSYISVKYSQFELTLDTHFPVLALVAKLVFLFTTLLALKLSSLAFTNPETSLFILSMVGLISLGAYLLSLVVIAKILEKRPASGDCDITL